MVLMKKMENLEEIKEEKVKYEEVIRSISYNQKEILANIIRLHNNDEPFFADMTYSTGKFYSESKDEKFYVPQPIVKLDVCPQTDDTIEIDAWGKLPFEDNSIPSLVIDLPFVISPKNAPSMQKLDDDGSNIIAKRFSSYYPVKEMFDSYSHWILEAYRVLAVNGICVFKSQATVSGGCQLMTPEYSWYVATKVGFYTLDQFFLLAQNRLHSGKIKKQQHARKYSSTFYVFKKGGKKVEYPNFE